MKTLNIIGCGKVGQTLARLWAEQRVFTIGSVVNSTLTSSASAVSFVGSGQSISSITIMQTADVFLITTPDGQLIESCNALSASGLLRKGNIVFHCCGGLAADAFASVRQIGALAASVHPVKTFARAAASTQAFAGTFCGMEGDAAALTVLRPAFESIGAKPFAIDPYNKTIYHAAAVMVSNYLTALLEVGVQTYAKAGVDREVALQVMQPLVRETVDNVFQIGTAKALTGPIARGDYATVAKQLAAVSEWDAQIGHVYRHLGVVALSLSEQQGSVSAESLTALGKLLTPGSNQP